MTSHIGYRFGEAAIARARTAANIPEKPRSGLHPGRLQHIFEQDWATEHVINRNVKEAWICSACSGSTVRTRLTDAGREVGDSFCSIGTRAERTRSDVHSQSGDQRR